MSGDWLALGAVAALALAGARRGSAARASMVSRVLSALGLEVGDYSRDSLLVLTSDTDAYQVKLEGWGSACVAGMCPAIPAQQRKTAIAEARRLAAQWKRQGYSTGVQTTDDPEVWAITWGVHGPLDHHVMDSFNDDDILDIRS